MVALLSVGSAGKEKVELIGDAGSKQLVAAQEEGEKGLAAFFEKQKDLASGVLGADGMPPLPAALGHNQKTGEKKYDLIANEEQTYGPDNA